MTGDDVPESLDLVPSGQSQLETGSSALVRRGLEYLKLTPWGTRQLVHGSEPLWRATAASIRGAMHKRAEKPGQDYAGCHSETGAEDEAIVIVSDGHGSTRNFRSADGARLAVEVATKVLTDFIHRVRSADSLSSIKREAVERLPKEMVRDWQEAVKDDVAEHPFTDQESEVFPSKSGHAADPATPDDSLLAYGATLLAVLATRRFILYLQLGDGDVITVGENGEVDRPVPKDSRLIANETTSLCSPMAWNEVRVVFHTLSEPGASPALVLAATDGYSNSFATDEGFLKVGSDMLEITRENGLGIVTERLATWLDEASEIGSGDDISVGIICRTIDTEPQEATY